MITATLPLRGADAHGMGHFGASRGSRKHNGIDYACYPGTELTCPADGIVTKIGYPYKNEYHFRYVEVTDDTGHRHRLFYVDPLVSVGDHVLAHTTIVGRSQDISSYYDDYPARKPMKNHVHYEIINPQGDYINPEEYK